MIVRRILMTADTVGGVWTYALGLARALGEREVAVGLATMGAPLTHGQRLEAAAIPSLTIFESTYRLEWMDEPWSDVERAGDWLLTLENEFRPDLIHLNGYAHGHLPWRAPHLVVGHSCVLSWWRAVKGQDAPAGWARYREALKRGLHAADRVIAPSRTMLAALEEHYGRIEAGGVVPNGQDPRRYRAGVKEPFVFAAGRVWDEAKNLALLGELRGSLQWPVRVAGSDRHPDGAERGLSNLTMLGVLTSGEVASWLSRASIYCLPARYEPFGLSVLEAAMSGCALVLGDIPSLRENWDGAAAFVPAHDADALEEQLNELIGNAVRRQELASAAHRRAQAFTLERMAAGYMELYRDLAAQRDSVAAHES